MIVCPNCDRLNPDGAEVCEACYTPLPSMTACPQCGAAVQKDATFCGQCGYNLVPAAAESSENQTAVVSSTDEETAISMPDNEKPDPQIEPEPASAAQPFAGEPSADPNAPVASEPTSSAVPPASSLKTEIATGPPEPGQPATSNAKTQLQQQAARLLHVQTNQLIELPQNLSAIHMGKPNDRIPPDIDVSGFPNADVVSRIHADIRVEGDGYYIEDTGSSNGTYINNISLPVGNRHRLRPGDRIALGKHDLVTFLFQLS